jgi:aryl-alcohol dehydrogenase-like predicted oxidoreductase
VPVLGLGTAPAGHRPEREAVAFFRRCIDAGVTHFDTGPLEGGYGNAQAYLGQVLPERRGDVFVATRCSEPDGEKALRQLKQNLREMRIDRADLVYAQSIGTDKMPPEAVFAEGGAAKALEKARHDGLTRFLGVSGHNRPGRFLQAMDAWDFDAMMTPASVVSRLVYNFEEEVWPRAREKGIGLLAMKVFCGVEDSKKTAKGSHLPDHLKEAGLRYALGLPGVSGVALGLYDEGELEQAVRWIRSYAPLRAEDLRALDGVSRDLAARWGELYGPRV